MPRISAVTAKSKMVADLVSLARRRKNHKVTADDAQYLLNTYGFRGSRNFIGTVLRNSSIFRRSGWTQSKITTNKSRAIQIWSLRTKWHSSSIYA